MEKSPMLSKFLILFRAILMRTDASQSALVVAVTRALLKALQTLLAASVILCKKAIQSVKKLFLNCSLLFILLLLLLRSTLKAKKTIHSKSLHIHFLQSMQKDQLLFSFVKRSARMHSKAESWSLGIMEKKALRFQ